MSLVWRADISVVVSGDHTRTIQIATPTVGGLMKFAVKTRTCLGCKTALKPTNSVPGESLPRTTSREDKGLIYVYPRWRRLQ